jgi:hypothetical protein
MLFDAPYKYTHAKGCPRLPANKKINAPDECLAHYSSSLACDASVAAGWFSGGVTG